MGTRKPILLVDDNEDDVLLMKRALKDAGVQNPVFVAEDGQQAIDYLSGTGPYADRGSYPLPWIALLDLKLPLKTGHEVLAWIRQQPYLDGVVVIVLTSSNTPVDLAAAYQLRANSYLVKPAAPERLLEMIKAFQSYWFGFNTFHHSAPQ